MTRKRKASYVYYGMTLDRWIAVGVLLASGVIFTVRWYYRLDDHLADSAKIHEQQQKILDRSTRALDRLRMLSEQQKHEEPEADQ